MQTTFPTIEPETSTTSLHSDGLDFDLPAEDWDKPSLQTSKLVSIPSPSTSSRRNPWVPQTTDFSILSRTRLLAIADDDKLFLTAKDAGLRFSYRSVLERLHQVAFSVTPVAMVTAKPGDNRREQFLLARGWKVQCIRREVVVTISGPTVKGNADFDFVYETARLLATGHFDAALLLTGDGDLAVSIARGVQRTTPQIRVVTLAVPGGASRRLRTRPDIFHGFIPAGLDICHDERMG